MTAAPGQPVDLVECGSASAALEGDDCGDVQLVASFPGGVLIGLIDGLGHGIEAAAAAQEAARVLAASAGEQLEALFDRCHRALRGTRGAVMSLVRFDGRASALTWGGVGNVEAFLLRADRARVPGRESIPLRGGIVGYQLPAPRLATHPVSPGDLLVMATDGIHSSFGDSLPMPGSAQQVADALLARHARGSDDAYVVVARYLGGTA